LRERRKTMDDNRIGEIWDDTKECIGPEILESELWKWLGSQGRIDFLKHVRRYWDLNRDPETEEYRDPFED
jgi:hypothetical protein